MNLIEFFKSLKRTMEFTPFYNLPGEDKSISREYLHLDNKFENINLISTLNQSEIDTLTNLVNKINKLTKSYETSLAKDLFQEIRTHICFMLCNGTFDFSNIHFEGKFNGKKHENISVTLSVEEDKLVYDSYHYSSNNTILNKQIEFNVNNNFKTLSEKTTKGDALFNVNCKEPISKFHNKKIKSYKIYEQTYTYDDSNKLISETIHKEDYAYKICDNEYVKNEKDTFSNCRNTTTTNYIDDNFSVSKNIIENDFPSKEGFRPKHYEHYNIYCNYPCNVNRHDTSFGNLISKEQYENAISGKKSIHDIAKEKVNDMINRGESLYNFGIIH